MTDDDARKFLVDRILLLEKELERLRQALAAAIKDQPREEQRWLM